mmetsp:Transcript_103607/g.292422  ORF Transcript_103607/g.292422 Transcript_103607/m.292422 type:complete len:206 (-) Transcript_103607:283-900(-)
MTKLGFPLLLHFLPALSVVLGLFSLLGQAPFAGLEFQSPLLLLLLLLPLLELAGQLILFLVEACSLLVICAPWLVNTLVLPLILFLFLLLLFLLRIVLLLRILLHILPILALGFALHHGPRRRRHFSAALLLFPNLSSTSHSGVPALASLFRLPKEGILHYRRAHALGSLLLLLPPRADGTGSRAAGTTSPAKSATHGVFFMPGS